MTQPINPVLRAVCDVLMVRVLETIGKRILKSDRARHRILGNRPVSLAHTIWATPDAEITKALRGQWTCLPDLVCCHGLGVDPEALAALLDSLVRDLVSTATPYHVSELDYRLASRLATGTPDTADWEWETVTG